jgi:geranylgeranylglycerol-phosphate geranylgeranyltransferase
VIAHLLDERDPRGGRFKAWLFLTHPGPSLLVTVVVVAAAGLLDRRMPGLRSAAGLVLVMLPAQLGIGALNDWADAPSDAVSKPFKPLARGLVGRTSAALFAGTMFVLSLGAAAWLGRDVLLVDLLGLAAGIAYDLALKRTPLAVLAWWAGFTAVPLLAMVMTGRLRGGVAALPLAGLTAVALLLANGLPDSAADSAAGARTLPAVLGDAASRAVMAAAMLAAAVYVLALARPLRQDGLAVLAAAALAAGASLGAAGPRWRPLTFPALSALIALAAVSWLASLPVAGG